MAAWCQSKLLTGPSCWASRQRSSSSCNLCPRSSSQDGQPQTSTEPPLIEPPNRVPCRNCSVPGLDSGVRRWKGVFLRVCFYILCLSLILSFIFHCSWVGFITDKGSVAFNLTLSPCSRQLLYHIIITATQQHSSRVSLVLSFPLRRIIGMRLGNPN